MAHHQNHIRLCKGIKKGPLGQHSANGNKAVNVSCSCMKADTELYDSHFPGGAAVFLRRNAENLPKTFRKIAWCLIAQLIGDGGYRFIAHKQLPGRVCHLGVLYKVV